MSFYFHRSLIGVRLISADLRELYVCLINFSVRIAPWICEFKVKLLMLAIPPSGYVYALPLVLL